MFHKVNRLKCDVLTWNIFAAVFNPSSVWKFWAAAICPCKTPILNNTHSRSYCRLDIAVDKENKVFEQIPSRNTLSRYSSHLSFDKVTLILHIRFWYCTSLQ